MKFKRDITSLDAIFGYLSNFIEEHRIDSEAAYILNLVVEELFTNLVKYDPGAEKEIPISLSISGKKVEIEIVNNGGHEFDITEAYPVDTNAPLESRPVGGLGIHLVRNMVDDIKYSFVAGTSTIRIVKYLEAKSV